MKVLTTQEKRGGRKRGGIDDNHIKEEIKTDINIKEEISERA